MLYFDNVGRLVVQNHVVMAALFRRPSRLLPLVGAIALLYVLVIFVPRSQPPEYYGFRYYKSSFDWSTLPQRNPVGQLARLPRGRPKKLPRVQHDFAADAAPTPERLQTLADRRADVKAAFVKSWQSYKAYAWMYDELRPESADGIDTFGGWAATLVDSLDSLWVMGLHDDFSQAAAAACTLDWSKTKETACNFFETSIRHLGGLLSAYDLSGEPALLEKAIELGDMLYSAYDTPNRMPPFWLDFELAKAGALIPGTHDPSASVASQSVEFTRLAQLTGNDKYYDAIDRVTRLLDATQNTTQLPGMWPTFFDLRDEVFSTERSFTLGALADSLYEYFPKMFALTGGLEPVYEKLYRDSMDTATKYLLFRPMLPDKDDILFSGSTTVDSQKGPELDAEGQHLSCFVGGMFGLGGKLFNVPEHVELAEKLAKGCGWAYGAFPTGIMPEIFTMFPCPTMGPCEWDEYQWALKGNSDLPKGFKKARDPKYILRPEAIESIFYMYRITGKEEYQEMAWTMYQAIKKATETKYAFSAIDDVTVKGQPTKKDSMESFWLSETLKYFYLIFSPPSLISLDEYVLNTEAHPFLRP